MKNNLFNLLLCPHCESGDLSFNALRIECSACKKTFEIIDNIPRFVTDEYHSNFGYQWNKFSKVQLDSFNNTDLSESRLLIQSGMQASDFDGKTVLEVGAGNGRFTEILLKFGANVVAVDYSSAIDANYSNNYTASEKAIFLQADLFCLPFKKQSFDYVICYGVIQHTGNNEKALLELCKYPKKGGKLFVDIYSNGLKYFNPWVYIIRPFFSLIKTSNEQRLAIVSKFVNIVFPSQVKILKLLHKKKGILKLCRYMVNRSPNSVYGINLYLDNKINLQLAKDWSVMDTFDGWAPKHDHPISTRKWINMITYVTKKEDFTINSIDKSGQGHTASLARN
jgi:ubiquinone/menaquinone biosynthesis C-methylase UbiE